MPTASESGGGGGGGEGCQCVNRYSELPLIWSHSKCPDYWCGLNSGVNLYYKGTFQIQGGHISGVLIRESTLILA